MDLQSAAAIATIVGVVITATGTVLALLGKLHLRPPTKLSTIQGRAVFVLGSVIISLPIIAWGPTFGLLPAIANLLIIPSVPGFLEEQIERSESEEEMSVADIIVCTLLVILAFMNFFALITIRDPSA